MNVVTKPPMTVDEFLAWADAHPGRYELFRGEVFPMSPEAIGHTKIKGAVYVALLASVKRTGIACHVLTEGPTIRVDGTTAYEPDALVYCGDEQAPSAIEVPNPVIVVEVISPGTRRLDTTAKLTGYFRIPTVAHYLIVDPTRPVVLHHARGIGDAILTKIVTGGEIALDPPGLTLALADIYTTSPD